MVERFHIKPLSLVHIGGLQFSFYLLLRAAKGPPIYAGVAQSGRVALF